MSGVDRAAASVFGAHVLWCRQALLRRDVIEKRGPNARRPKAAFPRGRQLSHPPGADQSVRHRAGHRDRRGHRPASQQARLSLAGPSGNEAGTRFRPRPVAPRRRQTLLDKYEPLPDPPDLSEVERVLGVAHPQGHHWFDHLLLAALHANAVHYLITNDQRMHRKARRLGISSERILTLAAAHDLLDKLADHPQNPPPQVRTRSLHALRRDDSIFESLSGDYPNFDRWFRQVSREGRQAWVIEPDGDDYAGICIWKPRDDELRLGGKVMKISTFKVAEEHRGPPIRRASAESRIQRAAREQITITFG